MTKELPTPEEFHDNVMRHMKHAVDLRAKAWLTENVDRVVSIVLKEVQLRVSVQDKCPLCGKPR